MNIRVPLCLIGALLVSTSWAASGERRFAISVGHNRGSVVHAPLRFAEEDARRFARTLTELGGFAAEDVFILRQPTRTELEDTFRALEAKIAAVRHQGRRNGQRTLLLFYWSGHATERGLEFGAELLRFDELKALLGASQADVRLAFVDACKSGGLIAKKGGRPTPAAFQVDVTNDQSPDGTAMVTSSGPGENALESAELRGSFFTHHLSGGLRGAADSDLDGRVTLQEAYRYAYARTVAHSMEVSGVAQRPTYAVDLRGKGELVLSELRRAEGWILFPPAPQQHGLRWMVVRDDGPPEVTEVRADPTRVRSLALSAGRYRLVQATAEEVWVGGFELARGQRVEAKQVRLTHRPYGERMEKGDVVARVDEPSAFEGSQLQLAFGVAAPMLRGGGASPTLAAGLILPVFGAAQLSWRATIAQGSGNDQNLPYRFWGIGADGGVSWPIVWEPLRAGVRVGGDYVSQTIGETASGGSVRGKAVGVMGWSFAIGGRWRLGVEVEGGGAMFKLNGQLAFRPQAQALTGVFFRL